MRSPIEFFFVRVVGKRAQANNNTWNAGDSKGVHFLNAKTVKPCHSPTYVLASELSDTAEEIPVEIIEQRIRRIRGTTREPRASTQ